MVHNHHDDHNINNNHNHNKQWLYTTDNLMFMILESSTTFSKYFFNTHSHSETECDAR